MRADLPGARRVLVFFCVWILILAQSAAFVHDVVHRTWARSPVGQEHVHASAVHFHAAASANWLIALFDGHQDGPHCGTCDAVTQGFAIPTSYHFPSEVLVSTVVSWTIGEAASRWAALFDARGPPAAFPIPSV